MPKIIASGHIELSSTVAAHIEGARVLLLRVPHLLSAVQQVCTHGIVEVFAGQAVPPQLVVMGSAAHGMNMPAAPPLPAVPLLPVPTPPVPAPAPPAGGAVVPAPPLLPLSSPPPPQAVTLVSPTIETTTNEMRDHMVAHCRWCPS